ncbi:hypothetical protein ROA7450_03256 [Roseovarius albus]|uniref:Uncharacterized protein n=1 Tax=Roseovarius albus TaxID=1247867 RepID=A0A1X6ZX45_9RHOB|nr:hypothetical protein [Roseovarius albus]SLN62209.1 hypothetical protein ROA7450_03256 [Roseovarius albus]
MASIATPNTSAGESASYAEVAAIECVLRSSFGMSEQAPALENDPTDEALYLDLSAAIAGANGTARPCPDQHHHVSLIDVTGPSAAAIVEFTDCSGVSFPTYTSSKNATING